MKLFKKLVTLAVGSILVLSTGCKGNGKNNSEPLGPYDLDGYNVLTPFEGGDIVDVDEDEVEEILDENLGEGAANAVRDLLGDYLYDFTLEHSHMTAEELGEFITLIVDITSEEGTDMFPVLAEKVPTMFADTLLATLLEIKEDARALGEFNYLLISDDSYEFGSGPRANYVNANAALNGSDAGIATLAEQEIAYKEARIGFYGGWYASQMVDEILTEEGIYFIRFAQNFLKSLHEELKDEEIIYVLGSLFDYHDDGYDLAEEYVNEHFAAFLNRFSKVLAKANLSTNSFAAIYHTIETIVYCSNAYDRLETDEFIEYSYYSKLGASIRNLFAVLNPKGLNVLVTFAGQLAERIDDSMIWTDKEWDSKDEEWRYEFYFNFKALASLFNELYGALAAEDKAAMNEATGTFGFQLSDFALALENSEDVGDGEDFSEIAYQAIGEGVEAKFDMGDYLYGNMPEDLFLFKQGKAVTAQQVEDLLNGRYMSIYDNDKGGGSSTFPDGKYVKNLQLVEAPDFNTVGQQVARVRFDFYRNGQTETKDFAMLFTVLPETITKFCRQYYVGFGRAYLDGEEQQQYEYYGAWCERDQIKTKGEMLRIPQNYNDHATETEYHFAYNENSSYYYVFDGTSFAGLSSLEPNAKSVKFSQLDFTKQGVYFYPTSIEYKDNGLFPTFIRYQVA